MSDTKKLLETRKTIKSKKPEFLQQDYHKKRRLSKKWKRPTGLQSKMRHQFRGYNRRVKQGWRSPVEIRGYHGKGYDAVVINTIKDLESLKKEQAVIIAANVGLRKKLILIDAAEKMGFIIINLKSDVLKKKAESMKKSKEESKRERDEKKKKTTEDSLKKAEEKKKAVKKKDEAASEETVEEKAEEKKAEEKKEKDEVLIHKQ